MKHIILLIIALITLLTISTVTAVKVGVVVDLGSTDYTGCVVVPTNADGHFVMEETPLSIDWSEYGDFGHALCMINGIGDNVIGTNCDWGSEYWNFYTGNSGEWTYSNVGFDAGDSCWNGDLSSYGGHYCAQQGNVIGLAYGEWNTQPNYYSYAELCPIPLEVTELKVEVAGDRDRSVDETGGSFKAKPGDEIELRVTVENILDSADMPSVNDIKIAFVVDNVGNDDIDEESDDFSLDPGEDDDVKFTFRIPYDADDKTYDGTLTVIGEDDDGEEISLSSDIDIKVKRDTHELLLSTPGFSNTKYSCVDTASLQVQVVNIGDKDEDVTLFVGDDSGVIALEKTLSLDKDDDKTTWKNFLVPLKGLEPGTHMIMITAEYGSRSESTKTILVKEACGGDEVVDEPVATVPKMTLPAIPVVSTPTPAPAPIAEPVTIKSKPESKPNTLMISLGVMIVVLGLALLVVGGMLMGKK